MSIDIDRKGHVAVITINRPDARNALDPEHNDALGTAVADFEADDDLYVAVLTGAGDVAFSAGADLKTLLPAYRSWGTRRREGTLELRRLHDRRTHQTDRRGAQRARPGRRLRDGPGLRHPAGRPQRDHRARGNTVGDHPRLRRHRATPRAIPLGAAMEMILTGDPVDAAEAHRLGLVNRVVPREQLLPVAVDLAQRIAARGPLAVRAARAAVLQGFGLPEQEALRNEFEHFFRVVGTADAAEGYTAFTEKREPNYRGR